MAVLRCALSVLVLAVLCLDGRRGASARCLNAGWDILDRVPVKASNAAVRGVSAVDELALREYLSGEYERGYTALCNRANLAQWNYNVDLLNQTIQDEGDASSLALAAFTKEQWEKHFKSLDETQIKDSQLRRQVSFLKSLGKAALSSEELSHFNERQRAMTTTYSTAKVCPYKAQQCDPASEGLSLDPGIEEVISTSRDYDELLYIWKEWHDKSGKKMREDYKEYVALSNKAARANGFNDMGEMWQGMYEVDEFQATIDKLWQEVSPLYQELHTYTLNKLKKVYAGKISDDATLIPGHVLGNMWGQSWINLYDLLVPYPDASSYDVTNALVKQGYTPRKMFETADEFYQSLGLPPNDMCYGPLAMIEKPTDGREVTCHASAWDLCDGTDFRVKMCTKVNQEDFRTIHHEMGHIQYFLQYAHLPSSLRDGANPGFHEAIGDTIALSVDTPKHLQKIKLLEDYTDTKESRVNALMKMALEKVAFLPFGLLVDMWRWDVFSGKVPESGWNAHWWSLREKYQLLSPPVDRSENDFDPGAKYHVPADSKYISYFVAHILEFQLYRAMCIEAGEYDPNNPDGAPLHTCDFYQSKEAGKKFGDGLALGASVHWTEVLQVMTGSSEMSGQALVEYFKPLHDFLREANGRSPSSAQLAAPGLLLALIVPLALLGLT